MAKEKSVAFSLLGLLLAVNFALFRAAPVVNAATAPAEQVQKDPAIACTATGCLAVWEDYRGGIRGTRLGSDGAVIDPEGLRLTQSRGKPAIATDGEGYLVAWVSTSEAAAVRVGADGVVLDAVPLRLPGMGVNIDVSWDGQQYLVVWGTTEKDGSPHCGHPVGIKGARVSKAGIVLDPAGIPLYTGTGDFQYDPLAICTADAPHTPGGPAVSWDGENWMVAFDTWGETKAVRLTPQGEKLSPVIDVVGSDFPDVSFSGSTHLVVAGGSAVGVSRDGEVGPSTEVRPGVGTSVSSGGPDLLIASGEGNVIQTQRILASGVVHQTDQVEANPVEDWYFGYRHDLATAWTGSSWWVLWTELNEVNGDLDIYGVRLNAEGRLLSPGAVIVSTKAVPGPVLTVSKSGSGSGIVTSNPGGINCGGSCSASYAPGTVVTLTATAASGSTFAGWSGACTGTGSCVVTMDASKSVAATFWPSTFAPICTSIRLPLIC